MKEIANFYYINYKNKIGYYDSYRNFCLKNMIYFGLAISTPETHVDSTPTIHKLSTEKSNDIRTFIYSSKDMLKEILEPNPAEKKEYFKVVYVDGTEQCFEHNEHIHSIFENHENFKINGKCNVLNTPYLIFEDEKYSKIISILKEISQLVRNKQFHSINQFLHDDCALENYINNSQKTFGKENINKLFKKFAGILNLNLSKYSFYPTLEGKLTTANISIIDLKVELTDKKYNRTNYIFETEFNKDNKIINIKLYNFDKNINYKTLYGEALEKATKGTFNDYKTL